MPRLACTALMVLCASATVGSGPASAATFCVATGAQLYSSLQTAQNNGASDEIRIRSGVMSGTGAAGTSPRWSYRAALNEQGATLTISGGWDSTCATQTLDPLATQLDAQNAGTALEFRNLAGEPLAVQISVRNLTVSRGRALSDYAGAGINYFFDIGSGGGLLLENLLVTTSTGAGGRIGGSAIRVYQSGSGFARLRNLVVSNNQLGASGSGGVEVDVAGNAVGYVINNSIFSNSGSGPSAGLALGGAIVASNNVVAGNTSSSAGAAQAYATTSTGITLRNNHFETQNFTGGNQVESGTTSGDPQWNLVGSVAVPKPVSVLRDSGINSPLGQLGSTDFAGDLRIVNSTVDRGAIEAALAPSAGPTISAVDPVANSTSSFAPQPVGTLMPLALVFAANGGTLPATTTLACTDNSPNVTVSTAPQTIGVGDPVSNVFVVATQTAIGYTAQITCTATTAGASNSLVYFLSIQNARGPLGPAIAPAAPLAGSTTALGGSVQGELVASTLTFSTGQGESGGSSTMQCAPLSGVIVVTGNGSQTVPTGGSVLPVGVAMSVGAGAQTASVRCTVQRGSGSPSSFDYTFTLPAASSVFVDGFE